MDINIVIVNYKMSEDVDRCLTSLFNDIKDDNLKIIVHVVDNSQNQDNIKEMLISRYPQVNYIDAGKNIGFGAAQNLGLRKIKARFYLVLNPDIDFLSGSNVLSRMIAFMEFHPSVGIAGPKLLNLDGSTQYSCYRFPKFFDQVFRRLNLDKKNAFCKKRVDYYLMKDFDHNKIIKVDWVMGAFMFMRDEMVEEVGLFDEAFFMYFEDCDLCRRASIANWEVFYVADIVIKHSHRRDSAKNQNIFLFFLNKTSRFHFKSWLRYCLKW